MNLRLLVASICLASLVGVVQADDAAKKLEGTWTIESATKDGKERPEKGGQVFIVDNKITVKPAKGIEEMLTFKVDQSKKPNTIDFDFVGETPKNAAPGKGIYELDGDSLKLCIGAPDKRPTEFSDKGATLMVLMRKK